MLNLLLFILINITFSQEKEITLDWELNFSKKYSVSIQNEQNQKSNISRNFSKYFFTLKLVEISDEGYIYSWKVDSVMKNKDLSGVSAELEVLMQDLEIRYFTSPKGIYKSVENWEDILNFFETKLQKIEDDFWGDPKSAQYVKSLKTRLLNPEEISEYLLGEINLFHNFYGAKLTIDKNEVNNTTILDEYFNIPLPIINESILSKKSNGYYLEINEKIDQLQAASILDKFEKENQSDNISYTNSQKFTYHFDSKFKIKSVVFEKEIKINKDYMNKYIELKEIK